MPLTLADIAIGSTYRLLDRRVGSPLVIVEYLWVYTYRGQLVADVMVYEPARQERYPTDPMRLARVRKGKAAPPPRAYCPPCHAWQQGEDGDNCPSCGTELVPF